MFALFDLDSPTTSEELSFGKSNVQTISKTKNRIGFEIRKKEKKNEYKMQGAIQVSFEKNWRAEIGRQIERTSSR